MGKINQTILGIDLGMDNSLVAYKDCIAERNVCCLNADGHIYTPSVIHFETADSPIIGEVAKELSILAPDRTIANYKREIGMNKVVITVDGKSFTAEQLATLQIKALLKDAEAFLESVYRKAVITIPVTANQSYMKAILDAGKAAGLEEVYLISEVVAAICHYDSIDDLDGKAICVFDMGGGTLDIAVAIISKETIDIVIALGNPRLGGKDFDDALGSDIKNTYVKNKSMSAEDEQKLVLDVERAKKILSKKMQTRFILTTEEDRESVTITREEFEACTSSLLKKVEDSLVELQREMCDKNILQLDKIYMVGGSTKMPQIISLIEKMFPKVTIVSKNPDEAVALGAAEYAQRIVQKQSLIKVKNSFEQKKLKTVSAKSYGIAVQLGDDGEKKIYQVIPRGTELPITVKKAFYTKEKDQKEVTMRIYETMSKDLFTEIDAKSLMGTGHLKIQKSLPKHSKVWMKFSMGVDGVLVVEGVEKQGKTMAELRLKGSVA